MLHFTMETQAICVNEGSFTWSRMSCWRPGHSIWREGSSSVSHLLHITSSVTPWGLHLLTYSFTKVRPPLCLCWVAWELQADKELWIWSKQNASQQPFAFELEKNLILWPLTSPSFCLCKSQRDASKHLGSLMDRYSSYTGQESQSLCR